jgi:hypothetical protein
MKKKESKYRSPESRARQLAGLSGVKVEDHVPGVQIEKVNGKGSLASVTEDVRKAVIDLYTQGHSAGIIAEKLGMTYKMVVDIQSNQLAVDPAFRESMHKQNLRERLKVMVSGTVERLNELMPEMSAKDAALAMGIGFDKLMALDRNSGPETLHQHLHLHAPTDIAKNFMDAMKPQKDNEQSGEGD